MEKTYAVIFILFILIIISWIFVWMEINKFMFVLKTCDDDFALIKKCKCVPCSWQNAEEYNGNNSCDNYNLNNNFGN
jgi:hypothetical protein